jgi:hypothetical protein
MEHSGQGLAWPLLRCAKQAGAAVPPAGCRSAARGLALKLLSQGVQEAAHSLGAPGRGLAAVEERTGSTRGRREGW